MGKNNKKSFINKKNSATFQLVPRDTATAVSGELPESERVFMRVDNNPYSIPGFESDDGELSDDERFADADADADDEVAADVRVGGKLPEHVRKEIVELGFPDDGYDYLKHLREIKNNFYQNPKAKVDQELLDVKAYDASRIKINVGNSNENSEANYLNNASKVVTLKKVQKAVDPDVARLLDDGDLSRFGSDAEDLELDDDFMIKANLPDGEEEEEEKAVEREKVMRFLNEDDKYADADDDDENDEFEVSAEPRVRRPLDEQFDLLRLQEYDTDSDDDDGYANYMGTEDEEPLATILSDALKQNRMANSELKQKYKAPKESDQHNQGSDADVDLSNNVIQKCMEYAENYCNESEDDKDVVLVEESSDESEKYDIETIVSTYSNLDNHPGKIQAPGIPKKRLPKTLPLETSLKDNIVIALRGKQKLPVEFLPRKRKTDEKVKADEKAKAVKSNLDVDKQKRKKEESKQEKKERKAAVKVEKREARQAKKELRTLYKCEAQNAQKVAAKTGPSSVHLV